MQTVLWWHLHQPDYRHPSGTTAGLPWVRMHALRAYTDLCAMAVDTGLSGMTINIVPSLADQLDDIATGRCEDRHHALARRVSEGDTSAHLDAFRCHAAPSPVPLQPLARLDELRQKASDKTFSPSADDVTDACALFHLSWIGFTIGARAEVKTLFKRGRGYTRDDVAALLRLSREASAEVLSRFRAAREAGSIHLTTTPYFHPILPLVVDGQIAKEATSDRGAPTFAYPSDATAQVVRALDRHEALFGERPAAMWPAEGALSEEAATVIANAGVKVAASDEELLRKSLRAHSAHDVHLHPWKHEASGLGLLFRDRALSDNWGFSYRDLSPDVAARAFVDGLDDRKHRGGSVCSVILDGENPFEFYPGAGRDHLHAFAALAKTRLELVSPEEAAEQRPQKLKRLATGSWIHASLDIWAGDDEDRRGWALLNAVRGEVDLAALSAEDRAKAEHHLFAAEGSDWFWWYGPEFDIPDAPAFDALFRGHLKAALAFAPPPIEKQQEQVMAFRKRLAAALERPVFSSREEQRKTCRPPWPTSGSFDANQAALSPLEKENAIHVGANEDGGAMHKADAVVEDIWVRASAEELSVAFATRADVAEVTVVVCGEHVAAGQDAEPTEAQRRLRSDDGRLQEIGPQRFGHVVFAWSELGTKADDVVTVKVIASTPTTESTLPVEGAGVRRPSPFQFEA